MGFWKSFANQVGRDTGRRVSRALYGKKHAIQVEHTHNSRSNTKDLLEEQQKLQRAEARTQIKLQELEAKSQRDLLEQQNELAKEQMQTKFNFQQLSKLSDKIDEAITYLNNMVIPTDSDALYVQFEELSYLLRANLWNSIKDDEKKRELINRYADAIYARIEQIYSRFQLYYPDTHYIKYVDRHLKPLRRKHFWAKHGQTILKVLKIIIFGPIVIAFILLMLIMDL